MDINLNTPRTDDMAKLTEAELDAHLDSRAYRHGELQQDAVRRQLATLNPQAADVAPAPAEASTEVGADEEDRSGDWPEGGLIALLLVLAIVLCAMAGYVSRSLGWL